MISTEAIFTKGDLMRHVTVMSLSSSLGIMAIYIVDLCDIFFISLLGEKQMAAAAGFASTIMFYVSAVSIGVSVAAGTLVATALGSDDRDRAREIAASCSALSVLICIALPAVMLIFVEELLGLVGATGEVAVLAKEYLWITLPASLFSGLSMVAVAALRSDGQAKWSMYPALAGAAVNLVMDPLLIFGLGLGLQGAAIATVFARLATLSVAFYAAAGQRSLYVWPDAEMIAKHLRLILHYTGPGIFASLAGPVAMSILTRYMAGFGHEAVAGAAVLGRLYPVVFSVVNALSGSMGPIVGQNFAADRIDRVREAFVSGLKFLAIYVALAGVFLFLLRENLADAFGLTGQSRDLLYLFCGPLAIVAFFNGSIFVANAVFTNTGRPHLPVWLSWARSTLGVLPFAHVGGYLMGPGGVLFGVTVGGAVFSLIAVVLSFRLISRSAAARAPAFQTKIGTTPQEIIHHGGAWET